jgi:hypothetical protein
VHSRPEIHQHLIPRTNEFIPVAPTIKQSAFLLLDQREALYGGSAGGGKSQALLMAALQYVDRPRYAALLLRRTYADLALPGALMDRARAWLGPTSARWNQGEKTWSFPSGATLTFGYLDHPSHKYRYQSSEFQFVGFDELTQFGEAEYTYLFSRLRRLREGQSPVRMRSASNPGGVGHDWVRRRFLVDGAEHGRIFIPASLDDNPHLDQQQYVASLQELDPLTRRQLLEGDWNASDDGLLPFDLLLQATTDCLWPHESPPKDARPELYVGVDVGRTRDLSVVWTWEKIGDVCWCRSLDAMANVSFREQRERIRSRLNRWVVRCFIDKGGVGYQLAEELEREHPGVVEGIQLTAGVQGRLARRLAVAFGEHRVRIPDDAAVRDDFRLVRRTSVVGGADRIETERGAVGHADRFWAAALGFEAAAISPPPTAPPRASLPRSHRPRS